MGEWKETVATFQVGMRVRIRDGDPATPLGFWGKEGLVVGNPAPHESGGESLALSQQLYVVKLVGVATPITVFASWLDPL